MTIARMCVVSLIHLGLVSSALSQVVFTGRVRHESRPGSGEWTPMTAVYAFASLGGADSEARAFRTWEMDPAGWFRISGAAGRYTLLFSTPAHFMRPILRTNLYVRPGDVVDGPFMPRFDYAVFDERTWDTKAATDYFQPFVARGTSVTQVGFKLVHDGVDGPDPGAQSFLVSIRRRGVGAPDAWEQIGPTVRVPDVDCGGAKNYWYSAGWDSGEVPLTPGETYAVHLRAEKPGATFQAFWRPAGDAAPSCYRLGNVGPTGNVGQCLWMAVATDGDGVVIPYNKHVHKQFGEFGGFARTWSQTYVAQGSGLAGVVLYAATSGIQPSQNRQRVVVRVRKGGPDGPVVGIEKIAIGNANYTGDASWGTFGAAYAPGEVPLEAGREYAIEFESLENYETLHGFVNIKNMVSDDRPGFNPYRKQPGDAYARGTAFKNGKEAKDFDLDMQVLEYRFAADNWQAAVESKNLLVNGDMEAGDLRPGDEGGGRVDGWRTYATDPGTAHAYLLEAPANRYRFVRVRSSGPGNTTVDGGYVQRVDGLSALDTYRLTGRVRSSWTLDTEHACRVGCDPTGQDQDAKAPTIVWTAMPKIQGIWVTYDSEPIRPTKAGSISVWLHGWTSLKADYPFKADFDDFMLRRVRTDVPDGR